MTLILFLLVLSLLVFVHELAHFLTAKRFGVGVEEFGFGLPPRLFGKKIGETIYSINALPFGGFVRLKGETGESPDDGRGGETLGFGGSGSFSAAPKKQRALIIVAGVFGNLLLGYLLLIILFGTGYPTFAGKVTVLEVVPDSPAAVAGLAGGDKILTLDGVKIEYADQLVEATKNKAGRAVRIEVENNGLQRTVDLTPRENPPEGQGALGVKIKTEGGLIYEKHPWLKTPVLAGQETVKIIRDMGLGWVKIVRNVVVKQEVPKEVTGVVGVYSMTGEAAALGVGVLLQFIAILSLNLFIFNLFPIPALDGGRLLFIGIETIIRRPLSPKAEAFANNLGLALILTIFVLITISDVRRFIL